ncbi:DUF1772 domain-containing protein [Agromyces atrinae]|nr:DUF1772 domain-containing protein [Agromyces atrinae]NYD67562.1 putative membrane protein [Agromyces atrinae]
METLLVVALAVAVVAMGLVAGYVFAYGNSVMSGLRSADDRTFVVASQKMITAVPNPIFIGLSNLPVLALGAALIAGALSGAGWVAMLLISSSLALYAATLGITFLVNVPLNNALLSVGTAVVELAQARSGFEEPWTRANAWRSATAVAAVITSLVALVLLS